MHKKLLYTICLIAFFSFSEVFAQGRRDSLHLAHVHTVLNEVTDRYPLYRETLDISVNDIPVAEFLKNIAKAAQLNLKVEPGDEKRITCNFREVAIKDILLYICKEYAFDVELTGNILSVYPCPSPYTEPIIILEYEEDQQLFTFDFTQAKITDVVRKFSEISGLNIIVPDALSQQRVTAYGKELQASQTLQTIAATNGLIVQKKGDAMWFLYRANREDPEGGKSEYFPMDHLEVDATGLITARINQANIHDMVLDLCQRLHLNYFFMDDLDHTTGVYVDEVTFDSFLKVLFTGTHYTWRTENGIYIFGKQNQGTSLSSTRVVPMKFRSVEKVTDIIPEELRTGMEIITFPDLNSLIVHGEQRKVIELIAFLREIDKSVPLISIDVIILDATDTNAQEVGVSMGLGKEPATTSGSLSPGVNLSMGASSVNKLLNSFNGFGSINLGRVSPNFYLSLKLLEEDGKIILRSTPRLSTLNGHKATLKSGEMKYYKESQTYLTGTQNPIQSESYQWKEVEANLSLDIIPYVSQDSCITLKIDLTQSEFTEREVEESPPGTTTRSFNSIIRVRNEEMVLLGGIERNLTSKASKGVPFLARVPVLKWLFGSSSNKKSIHKLNVFIKPTIIE